MSARRATGCLLILGLLFGACFGPDPNLTESGFGKPELSISFPDSAGRGSVQTAELTITNPGPGDMEVIAVAFARLGVPELPVPIVDVTVPGQESAIQDIEPAPVNVSNDGSVYFFSGLAEEESMTITFELELPATPGPAANSVIVYDGEMIDRARGVRLETTVR